MRFSDLKVSTKLGIGLGSTLQGQAGRLAELVSLFRLDAARPAKVQAWKPARKLPAAPAPQATPAAPARRGAH